MMDRRPWDRDQPGVAARAAALGAAEVVDRQNLTPPHLADRRRIPGDRCRRRSARGPMRRQQLVIVLVLALCVPGATRPARAEPTADQMLADIGLSVDERQQVMNGEFVTTRLAGVSERDLPVALIVFVVATSPDTLARQIMAGDFITTDPQ